MAANLKTFTAMFPELCIVDDNIVQVWIDEANDFLDPAAWGKCFDRACLYFAAHELALSQQRTAAASSTGSIGGGVIQSASADGISVSYAVPNFSTQGTIDESQFSKTPYGLKYLQLRDACLGGGRLAGTQEDTAADQVVL